MNTESNIPLAMGTARLPLRPGIRGAFSSRLGALLAFRLPLSLGLEEEKPRHWPPGRHYFEFRFPPQSACHHLHFRPQLLCASRPLVIAFSGRDGLECTHSVFTGLEPLSVCFMNEKASKVAACRNTVLVK